MQETMIFKRFIEFIRSSSISSIHPSGEFSFSHQYECLIAEQRIKMLKTEYFLNRIPLFLLEIATNGLRVLEF